MCLKSPVNDEGKSLTVYSKIYMYIELVNDDNVKPKNPMANFRVRVRAPKSNAVT